MWDAGQGAGTCPCGSHCRSCAYASPQRGARCQQVGAGGNGLICHFLCVVHLNNDEKATGLKGAGIMRRVEMSVCKWLIKIETQDTPTDANYLGWQKKRKQFSIRKICNVPGRRGRVQRRGLAGGAARRAHNGPHLITSWILAPASLLAGIAVPKVVPCIGGSLHPSSGVTGGTEASIPPLPLAFSKSSTHCSTAGCLYSSTPGEGTQAQGCSASG